MVFGLAPSPATQVRERGERGMWFASCLSLPSRGMRERRASVNPSAPRDEDSLRQSVVSSSTRVLVGESGHGRFELIWCEGGWRRVLCNVVESEFTSR